MVIVLIFIKVLRIIYEHICTKKLQQIFLGDISVKGGRQNSCKKNIFLWGKKIEKFWKRKYLYMKKKNYIFAQMSVKHYGGGWLKGTSYKNVSFFGQLPLPIAWNILSEFAVSPRFMETFSFIFFASIRRANNQVLKNSKKFIVR